MPGPRPNPIVLTERQRAFLKEMVRREKSTQQQVRRAKVILLAAEPSSSCSIATRLKHPADCSTLAQTVATSEASHALRRAK